MIAEQADALHDAVVEHYLSGEKQVRIFDLLPEEITALRKWLTEATIPETVFSKQYPALVPKCDLPAGLGKPTLVAIHSTDEGTAAIFASVRALIVREELEKNSLPHDVMEALEDFDELVGVRHVKWQAMDVLWVPREGSSIDLRIDFPVGMHQATADVALDQLKDAAMRASNVVISATARNLFPLIDKIYKAPSEGLVVELAFGTSTASLKHEKMRRRKTCLRQETYHVGGKNALASDIEIHRLSVIWKRPLGEERYSYPELTLNATARSAGAVVPFLTSVTIRDCIGQDDIEFVRSKILEYLAQS